MTLPQKREDFTKFFITLEDIDSGFDAFRDSGFEETMETVLKLNHHRDAEIRMEFSCDLEPLKTKSIFCSVGVLVLERSAEGYAMIHYSDNMQK